VRGAPGSEAALGSNYRQRSVAAQEAGALHGSPSRLRSLSRFTKLPRPKARQVAAYAGSGGVLLNPSPEQGRKQDEELRQHRQAKAASKGRTEDLSHRPESDFGGSNSRTAGAGSTAV